MTEQTAARCTLCGASRLLDSDGGPGVCSLLGCKNPMHDLDKERGLKAKKTSTEYDLPEDRQNAVEMVTVAALVYGFNELAKMQETLGAKAYYRLLRDNAEKRFLALGGEKFMSGDPPIATIQIPGSPQHIVFRPMDIELMRQTVAEWDARKP